MLFIRLHTQGIFIDEMFSGFLAFPFWSACFSLWFSAAVHWRLAND